MARGRNKDAPPPECSNPSIPDLVDRLRLIRSDNVGPITYHALLARFGSARDAIAALPSLSKRGGRRTPIRPPDVAAIEEELAAAARIGAQPLVHGTPDYPVLLAAIADAPPILYAIGSHALLQRPAVAIVGARNASAVGRRFAHDLAAELGSAGLPVVSGLARGIDTSAHLGALESGTIAVMAGGADYVYPPQNESLHAEICAQGCVVSEMPPGSEPRAQHFPRRNRIVAAVASAVVVVEGAARSGSLITARLAGEYGRDVLAVPGSPMDPRARGPNALIRQGAALCESADDVLALLEPARASRVPLPVDAQPDPPGCEEEASESERDRIVAALSVAPGDIDDIARLCASTPQTVVAVVMELELTGRAQRLPGHRVQLLG